MGGVEAGISGGCKVCPVGWPSPCAKGRRGAIRLGNPCGVLRRRFLEGGFGESLRRGTRGGSAEGWVISPVVRSEFHSRRRQSGDNFPRDPTGVGAVRRRILAARAPLQTINVEKRPQCEQVDRGRIGPSGRMSSPYKLAKGFLVHGPPWTRGKVKGNQEGKGL